MRWRRAAKQGREAEAEEEAEEAGGGAAAANAG